MTQPADPGRALVESVRLSLYVEVHPVCGQQISIEFPALDPFSQPCPRVANLFHLSIAAVPLERLLQIL